MAGNEQCDGIASDGGTRGARSASGADAFGNLAVARQSAFGNREKRLPDLDLPGRAEKLNRKLGPSRFSCVGGSEDLHGVGCYRAVVQNEARMGPARAHVGEQRRFLVLVAKGKTAKAAFRRCEERAPKQRRPEPGGDVKSGTALGVIAGRHRLDLER